MRSRVVALGGLGWLLCTAGPSKSSPVYHSRPPSNLADSSPDMGVPPPPPGSPSSPSGGLVQYLQSINLNALATVLGQNQVVVDAVMASPGTKTLLAPTDAAMARIPGWTTSNPPLLQATLFMHVLNGTFDLTRLQATPRHTVGHSLLTNPNYVNLPGGNGQAVALAANDQGASFVQEALNTNDFGMAPQPYAEFTIQPIQRALTVPGNATFTAAYIGGHTRFVELLRRNQTFADYVDNLRGSTLFVPSDAALDSLVGGNGGGSTDEGTLRTILSQHLVVNRTLYSPLFAQGTVINAAGQDVGVYANNDTVRVHEFEARITQYDIMHRGGVIHLIDGVLASTKLNQRRADEAATSAFDSANSYVAGAISEVNAASSQGQRIPKRDHDNPGTGFGKAKLSDVFDASAGEGAAAGTPGADGNLTPLGKPGTTSGAVATTTLANVGQSTTVALLAALAVTMALLA